MTVGGKPYEVETVWYHKEQPIFKFRGVDSISAAESLAGLDVCIPAGERIALPDGEYFFSDLMDCRMLDNGSGELIGTVEGWQECGPAGGQSQILLEVNQGRGGEPLLVPFARAILKKIDLDAREIRVEMPPGLSELNR